MAKYSIQDTSLIAIGDAIRNKTGKHTRPGIIYVEQEIPLMEVAKTDNATGHDSITGALPGSLEDIITEIQFPEASKIQVKMTYRLSTSLSQRLKIFDGNTDTLIKLYNGDLYAKYTTIEDTFETNYLKFSLTLGVYDSTEKGYYAECSALDADGNEIIKEVIEVPTEAEVKNTLTPAQMATEIEGLSALNIPAEAYEWNGSLTYTLSEDRFSWFINGSGEKISTENISNLSYFAYNAKTLEEIPFDINLNQDCKNLSFAFNECRNLKTAPTIRGTLSAPTGNYSGVLNLSTLFCGCNNLREIPYDYFHQFGGEEFWEASKLYYGNRDSIFENCFSLREIPDISMLTNTVSSYSCLYSDLVRGCYALNGIYNLPILPISFTFGSTSFSHLRAKDLIFETNEDGSAKTAANWNGVNLDLGTYPIGVTTNRNNVLNYNSGITADKEVTDNATYQALKDDPDWFTCKYDYSRYDHDSAVRTINSLPDVTGGNNNIITFRGQCGALTDGGAISTLTEEEIAVAAAKGWTVSFK